MATIDWQQVAAVVSILTVIGTIGLAVVQQRLAARFADRDQIEALEHRMTAMEGRVAGLATREDTSRLGERIGAVEASVASLGATATATRESNKRIEHQLDLVINKLMTETSQ